MRARLPLLLRPRDRLGPASAPPVFRASQSGQARAPFDEGPGFERKAQHFPQRRLRLSGAPGSFRRFPGNYRRQRNPVRGRAAAERSEGIHPSAAVTMNTGATKANKTRTGVAMNAEQAKSRPAR